MAFHQKPDGLEKPGAHTLTDDDLVRASGGTGCFSIQCKKCGKAFGDMDAYRQHVEAGCKAKSRR